MAISQVQSLHLLLASLFFLPALRAIDFQYCNQKGYDFGNITRVELSPNPVKPGLEPTVTIYGSASSAGGINEATVDVSIKSKDSSQLIDNYILCYLDYVDACPIRAGTKFVFNISDFPMDFKNHNDIKYGVSLLDDTDRERMCVKFKIPISTFTLASS